MILKLYFSLVFNTLLIILDFSLVEAVPEDYCLSPLNTSDCGGRPTPVFYYYKPGSRCEIKLWRGCPTENLFNTEYHCSHHCIGKLWSSEQNEKLETISKKSILSSLFGLKYRCDVPINTSQCKQMEQFVYTYDNVRKKCTEVTYYGCPTDNKFKDEEECQEICEETEEQWKQAIKNLDEEELNELNNLLDDVKNEIEPEKEDLKKNVKNSKIRPNTVSAIEEVTDLPGDKTNKIDNESKESTKKSVKPTYKPEAPTENPEAPTDKPEKSTEEVQSETKAETETAVATTNSALETTAAAAEGTTKLPVSTKRTRRKRVTKKSPEGEVVREGVDYNYE